MTLSPRAVLVIVFLLIYNANWGQCLKVEFYGKENYAGFLEEKVLKGAQELECIRLSSPLAVKSLKTDKCLILYSSLLVPCYQSDQVDVAGKSSIQSLFTRYSMRVDSSNPNFDMKPYGVTGFNRCSQKHGGGPQLDIDLTKIGLFGFSDPVHESWRGVCNCRNVPSRIINDPRSLDRLVISNFGNSVNIYEGENCQGQSKYIAAGMNEETATGSYTFSVRSFKPAELKNCYQLDAKIHKFHFRNGTDSIDGLAFENVQLATDSDVINNGASEITQTFKAKSSITETVEFSVAESFKTIHSAGTEASVEAETEVGVPLFAKAKVTAKVSANYQWTQEKGEESSKTTTVSEQEEIEINQEIKIPPCKVCHITTFVKKIKKFPVKYTAYAKVSAPEGEQPISSVELKQNLPAGMDYVKDINQHAIEARTEGIMYVDFGLKSLIHVNCDPEPIKGCRSAPTPAAYSHRLDHQVYEAPIHLAKKHRPTFLSFLKNAFDVFVKHHN